MSGLVTFIKVLFVALKQTQPKTNRAKGSANKTNCLRKQQQTTVLTGIPKLGWDKSPPLKMNLVPEIRRRVLRECQPTRC